MNKMTTPYWVLQHKDTREVLPFTLANRKFECEVRGANERDTSIADMREQGWKAERVQLEYRWNSTYTVYEAKL